MNYGSEPADQIVRYSLEGTEVALKLSGLAAKNFAMFVYAVLKDQKKTRGKTRLMRMLKDGRPFKFFVIPASRMQEFSKEANLRGLLYVPIRDKRDPGHMELAVFADDAAKVNRILDKLNLDFVAAQAGGATVLEKAEEPTAVPAQTETVQIANDAVELAVGGSENDFSMSSEGLGTNFIEGPDSEKPNRAKSSLLGPSSSSRRSSAAPSVRQKDREEKPSVKKELQAIKREQAKNAQPGVARSAPQRSRNGKEIKGRYKPGKGR